MKQAFVSTSPLLSLKEALRNLPSLTEEPVDEDEVVGKRE